MTALVQQRCFNHGLREAVARCPECGRFFCRECITEHEDRVICASCLSRLVEPSPVKRFRLVVLLTFFQCFIGFLVLWLCFYYLGRTLLLFPTSFHEGTLWEEGVWEEGDD